MDVTNGFGQWGNHLFVPISAKQLASGIGDCGDHDDHLAVASEHVFDDEV